MKTLRVMAWDTATVWCSAALIQMEANGNETIVADFKSDQSLHSQLLPTKVANLLKEAGLRPCDLNLLAVGRGPGSFTGLRTGLSLAKGLAMGADIPLLGFSTLEIIAAQIFEQHPAQQYVASVVDARHKEIFFALYKKPVDSLAPILIQEARPIKPGDFFSQVLKTKLERPIMVAGPATQMVVDCTPASDGLEFWPDSPPDSLTLARLALEKFKTEAQALDLYPPLPMYFRQPDIRPSGLVMR